MKLPRYNQGFIDTLRGIFAEKPERFGCRAIGGLVRVTTANHNVVTAVQFDDVTGNFPHVYDRAAVYSASLPSPAPYPIHQGAANPTRFYVPDPTNREMGNLGGIYELKATVMFDTNATGRREVYIRVYRKAGGNAVVGFNMKNAHATRNTVVNVATECWLNPGDYVVVQAFQDSGANLQLMAYQWYSNVFCMTLMR